jgi:hypothetical protein
MQRTGWFGASIDAFDTIETTPRFFENVTKSASGIRTPSVPVREEVLQ